MRASLFSRLGYIVVTAFLAAPMLAEGQAAQPGSPVIWVDYDEADIPEPAEKESGYYYDFLDGTFFQQVKQGFDFPRLARKIAGRPKQALNVNTAEGVPDSSWFTNRNGHRRMSLDEIRRGPNQDNGPAGRKFTVVRAKTVGITPG